ncbi:MAG: metallophosphoesterase [Aliarcobacter sp.]|jgi:serine/threonine protein phosphatase 1|nr:metallophosphoesterase [Aliarcobacter sp.]
MKNKNIYIIGDVHGCYKTLLALIEQLPKNAHICFVGDLINKGENSSDILDFIIENNYDCVLGNHEVFMIEDLPLILEDEEYIDKSSWILDYGGDKTLQSYKNSSKLKIHLEYLKSLPLYLEYKDLTLNNRYLVVSHSQVENKWQYKNYPVNSKEYKKFQSTVLNARYKNFDNKEIFNVFGHTSISKVDINEYKANIDLGCVYGETGDGLCALEFPSLKIFTQKNIE